MRTEAVLEQLADGACHSGEELARTFGVTRAAVWKQIGKLKNWGLAVEAAPGRGYRLARPLDLIDRSALAAQLKPLLGAKLTRLELFTELDSTNGHLLGAPPPAPGTLTVCIAEYQRAGRGRRGRRWNAPLAGALCLSAGWQFAETPPDLAALTLAVGVAVRRAVAAAAGIEIALKWPNDLVFDHRKLGGILLEMAGEAHGRCHVVAGIGINVSMPRALLASLSDWPAGAVDLDQASSGAPPARAALAVHLIRELAALFAAYPAAGFAPYRDEWRAADYLAGRAISVDEPAGPVRARSLGIEPDGALLIETAPGERRRVISGDVSVRRVA